MNTEPEQIRGPTIFSDSVGKSWIRYEWYIGMVYIHWRGNVFKREGEEAETIKYKFHFASNLSSICINH